MYLDGHDTHLGTIRAEPGFRRVRKASLNKRAVALLTKRKPKKIARFASVLARKKAAPVAVSRKPGFAEIARRFAKRGPMIPVAQIPPVPLRVNEPEIAPAASIPRDDFDGSELTQEERNALIVGAAPLHEPTSSGYVPSPEESFAPDVPEIIEPEDVLPPEKKKPSALPWLGGAILLLNFL